MRCVLQRISYAYVLGITQRWLKAMFCFVVFFPPQTICGQGLRSTDLKGVHAWMPYLNMNLIEQPAGFSVVYPGNIQLVGPFLILSISIKSKIKAISSAKPNSKQHPLELAKQHFIRKSPAEFRMQFKMTNWCVKWIYSESGEEMSQHFWKNHNFRISCVRAPNYKPTYTLVHGLEKSVHPDICCVHNFKKNKYYFGNCSGSFCQK